jgi:hypothetical protein
MPFLITRDGKEVETIIKYVVYPGEPEIRHPADDAQPGCDPEIEIISTGEIDLNNEERRQAFEFINEHDAWWGNV